jgi:hypothetical protein
MPKKTKETQIKNSAKDKLKENNNENQNPRGTIPSACTKGVRGRVDAQSCFAGTTLRVWEDVWNTRQLLLLQVGTATLGCGSN